MKRVAVATLLLALNTLAHAAGLTYAVESLEKAQSLAKQNTARHVLVFYTSPT
jgi:hypothetical protein